MKKIYSLIAVMGLVSLMAGAAVPKSGKLNKENLRISKELTSRVSLPVSGETKKAAKKETRAASSDEITGYYKFGAFLRSAYSYGGFLLNMNEDGKTVTLENIMSYPTHLPVDSLDDYEVASLTLKGEYNAETGILSIPNQALGKCELYGDEAGTVINTYDLRTQNGHWVPVFGTDTIVNGTDTVFKPNDKIVDYDYEVLQTPVQVAYQDGELIWLDEDIMFYIMADLAGKSYYYQGWQGLSGFHVPATLDNTGWADAGEVEYTDGWIAPALSQPIPSYSVKIQKSTTTDGLVRLVDPYGPDSPFARLNMSPCEGYILVDMSNPECVMALPGTTNFQDFRYYSDILNSIAPSGFYTEEDGMYTNTTKMGSFFWYQGSIGDPYTYEDMVDSFEGEIGSVDEDVVTLLDCQFGISNGFRSTAEYWYGSGEAASGDNSSFILPEGFDAGVNDILTDDINAPVRYFNLQGMEVKNPEAGQLVIKKKGGNTSKYIAK